MSQYHHYCKLCDRELSDTHNALSLHLTNTHQFDKQEYYVKYIDSRTTCKNCDASVPFRNLQLGYREYCPSCTVKIKQWGGERGEHRKKIHRTKIQERGGGAALGGAGKRKGVKNKNPYPHSESVIQRIEKMKEMRRPYNADPEKIAKQRQTWYNKSEEELTEIARKRDETTLSNNSTVIKDDSLPPQMEANLKIIFQLV